MLSTSRTKPWSSTSTRSPLIGIGLLHVLNFAVEIPARLAQILDVVALLPGSRDVFHRIAQAEPEAPRLYDLDRLIRVVGTAVMGRVVDRLAHPLPPPLCSRWIMVLRSGFGSPQPRP